VSARSAAAPPGRTLRVQPCFFSASSLQQLPSYAEHLSADLVNKDVFPQVSLGFMDTAPAIRELTVKSMLWLAPKLTPKNIDTLLLPKMAQLQVGTGHLCHPCGRTALVHAFNTLVA
jgi:hypothetical protein